MRAVAYIRIVVFPAVCCVTTMCRMMSMISLSVAPFSSSPFLICDFLQKPYLQVSESLRSLMRCHYHIWDHIGAHVGFRTPAKVVEYARDYLVYEPDPSNIYRICAEEKKAL